MGSSSRTSCSKSASNVLALKDNRSSSAMAQAFLAFIYYIHYNNGFIDNSGPSFIYLIPVMMLFGITDTSVLIAVVIYAAIPATRYTVEGLRSVPASLHDAGSMAGVNRIQRWYKIQLPLAFPHMMLGINQTVVFALFMVIIGAMIGTDDLGQYIFKALSDRHGIGNGIALGLCVAFIGLAIDQVIRTWADRQKKILGMT